MRKITQIFLIVLSTIIMFLGVAFTFNGSPSAPQTYTSGTFLAGWDVQVHSRDSYTWQTLESVQAQHGTDCSAPPATHENHTYEGSVYQCKDHFMTSINASGYGVIYLTPPETVDFSGGTATVKLDASTLNLSSRDWWDLWITPPADTISLPLDSWLPDLQGPPKNAIHIRQDFGNQVFKVYVIRNGVETEIGTNWWTPYSTILTPSATDRTTFQLEVFNTHVKFGIPAQTLTNGQSINWADVDIDPLGWNSGVVQIGHHSYNPTKDNSGTPGTWHWDNVIISPSKPFSITRLTPRIISDFSGNIVSPVPGTLKFGAICRVTLDGTLLTPQIPTTHNDHFNSYAIPITTGTHTIAFSPDDWYSGPCAAQDFHVWSDVTQTQTPASTPTAPATVTPTVTATATPTTKPTPIVILTQCRIAYQVKNANGNWVNGGYNMGTVSNGKCDIK